MSSTPPCADLSRAGFPLALAMTQYLIVENPAYLSELDCADIETEQPGRFALKNKSDVAPFQTLLKVTEAGHSTMAPKNLLYV
jgi:hypothetical protein